jgi:hypothetical protein
VTSGHPVFEWTPGVPILNEDETEGEELEEAKLETEDMPHGGNSDDELFDDDDETPCAPNDDDVNEISANDGKADETENEHKPSSEDESAANDDETAETAHDEANEDDDAALANDVENDELELEIAANEGASQNDEQRSDGRPERSEPRREGSLGFATGVIPLSSFKSK